MNPVSQIVFFASGVTTVVLRLGRWSPAPLRAEVVQPLER